MANALKVQRWIDLLAALLGHRMGDLARHWREKAALTILDRICLFPA
jgi:hypothetical protein